MILENWLEFLPRDRPVALLVRHAERDPLVRVEDALSARLTEKGKADARRLGAKLAGRPLCLFHSPIERCRETALALAAGAAAAGGWAEMGGVQATLGGPYMKDWDPVMRRVLAEGAGGFVRDWFAGRLPEGLVADARESARLQLSLLLEQLGLARGNELFINVSHDWNVLLVRHFYLDSPDTVQRWPEYLEAVAAWPEGGGFTIRQGARQRKLSP